MNNFRFETLGESTYMVYQLQDKDELDTLSLGMITNNKINGIAPILYTQMDENKYLKYNITSKVTVEQFFTGAVNKKRLLGVFSSIASAMLSAEEYMIDSSSFLLDMRYIFADVSSCDAIMVCLPLSNRKAVALDLGSFFKNIMFSTQFDQTENCDYVAKLINYLNGAPSFSLTELKKLVDDLKTSAPVIPQIRPVVQPPQQQVNHQAPNINMQRPMLNSVPLMPMQQPMGNMQNQMVEHEVNNKKEKKSWSLFGSKKKEKPMKEGSVKKSKKERKREAQLGMQQPKITKSSMQQPSFEIPGMQQPMNKSTQQAGVSNIAQVNTKQPNHNQMAQIQPMQSQPMQCQPVQSQPLQSQQSWAVPTMQNNVNSIPQQKLNFGETTLLGGAADGGTTVLDVGMLNKPQVNPYLKRTKNKEKIVWDKPVFRIGKEKSYVDYFISDNNAISRSHASIINHNGSYFVVDTNSTNHTFVDGKMIQSNIEVPMIDGTNIVLANEEFIFKLY